MSTHNLDGRDFIRNIIGPDLLRRWQDKATDNKISVVMNLPALAIEFLDAFRGLLSDTDPKTLLSVVLPTVYCYCFSKEADTVADAKARVEEVIKEPLPENHVISIVRDVAPNKDMLCVTFSLTESVLFTKCEDHSSGLSGENDDDNEPPEKRHKIVGDMVAMK